MVLLVNKPFIPAKLISFKTHSYLILKVCTIRLTGAFNLLTMISVFLLDLERAVRVVEGYEANSQKGVGAFTLDEKM